MNLRRRDLLLASGLWLLWPRAGLAAPGAPRRLDLKNAHTGETFNGPYRDAEGPITAAMADLQVFLRDFHVDKLGPVSIETLDFLADVMQTVGQSKATVLSAYRTPETNAKLRASMFGVAEKSQHLYGKAIDITFDARLDDAEKSALAMHRGGVGWYPNSHFIHLDSGPVRHWEMGTGNLRYFLVGKAPPHGVMTVKFRLQLQREYAKWLHDHGNALHQQQAHWHGVQGRALSARRAQWLKQHQAGK